MALLMYRDDNYEELWPIKTRILTNNNFSLIVFGWTVINGQSEDSAGNFTVKNDSR